MVFLKTLQHQNHLFNSPHNKFGHAQKILEEIYKFIKMLERNDSLALFYQQHFNSELFMPAIPNFIVSPNLKHNFTLNLALLPFTGDQP